MPRKYIIRTRCKSCGFEQEGIMGSFRGPHVLLLELHRLPGTHNCGEGVVGLIQAIRVEEAIEEEEDE